MDKKTRDFRRELKEVKLQHKRDKYVGGFIFANPEDKREFEKKVQRKRKFPSYILD